MTGVVSGRLTVRSSAEKNKWGQCRWLCDCTCGNTKIINGYAIRAGTTLSCGCYGIEQRRKHHFVKHGHARVRVGAGTTSWASSEYSAWTLMRDRCVRKKNKRYHDYGGRGISVCERWQGDSGFQNFLADMGYKPSKKHSLDRIDVNGNYEPSNCRWATPEEQVGNRRKYGSLSKFSD